MLGRRISYEELKGMLREELKLKKKDLSDDELKALWKALDADLGGFVSADEFGRFMRLGEPDKGPSWKERRQAKKASEGAAVREANSQLVGKALNDEFAGIEAASEEELATLSKKMNDKLQDPAIFPDPNARDWFKLFKHIDDDSSGCARASLYSPAAVTASPPGSCLRL